MSALLEAAIRRAGPPTLVMLGLLLSVLGVVAWGLAGIVHGLDLELALTLTGLGLVAGWLVAKSGLPAGSSALALIAMGLSTVFMRAGSLGGKLLALSSALVQVAVQTQRGRLDFGLVVQTGSELNAGIAVLISRLDAWLRAIAAGAPAFDPIATAMVWGALIWFSAAWAGWYIRRRAQPFPALLPALALLAIPFAYSGGEPLVLAALLLLLFSLLVLAGQISREQNWQARGIDYSLEVRFDLALVSIPIITFIVSLAALAPSLLTLDLVHWMEQTGSPQNRTASALPNSLGLVAKPRPVSVFDPILAPGLPRSHLIGSGPELTRHPVMTIKTNDPISASGAGAPRYYWRNSTYDVYTGQGWMTSGAAVTDYPAGTRVLDNPPLNHRPVGEQVQVIGKPDGLVYAAGDLLWADPDFAIAWRAGADAFSASIGASAYRVQSWVPAASEAQLNAAGVDYPQSIRDRYLQLPDTVPSRVLDLARSLTATEPTPYDRARAVERYLRAYPYTLDLPEPPSNVDVADYFLFDLKRGYCDYDATAFVVLARAAGLPARLAVGYATGQYDPATGVYRVTEADAHSWPQVYFPEYGWIDLEPTGGQPELSHAGELNVPEEDPQLGVATSIAPLSGLTEINRGVVVPASISLVLVALLVYVLFDDWRLRRTLPKHALGVLCQRLYRFRLRLDPHAQTGDTPYQVASALEIVFTSLEKNALWRKLAPRAIQNVRALTELYVRAAYGERAPSAAERAAAVRLWSRLRWYLWLARLFQNRT